jgi:hypothetical protein
MGLDAAYWKVQTPDGRLSADPQPSPEETSFQRQHQRRHYNSVYFLRHKADLQPVPPPKVVQPRMDIADDSFLQPSIDAKQTVFHCVGDTGAAKVNAHQTAAQAIANEASVADAMAADVANGGATGPPPKKRPSASAPTLALSMCSSATTARLAPQYRA